MPVSWTVSAWSSSQSSPEAPVGTGFTTGIPTSPSTWLAAAPSTVGSSYSSTPPRFFPDRLASPKQTPNLEFIQRNALSVSFLPMPGERTHLSALAPYIYGTDISRIGSSARRYYG